MVGRLATELELTVEETSLRVVSTMGACPVTVTVCAWPATASVSEVFTRAPTVSSTVSEALLKPACSASTRYVPTGSTGKENNPSEPLSLWN